MPIGPGTTGYIAKKWGRGVENDYLPGPYHALTKKISYYNPNLVRTNGVASTAEDPV